MPSLLPLLLCLAALPLACLADASPPRPFLYLSYDDLSAALSSLARDFPDLVKLQSANDLFSLPRVGKCGGKQVPCETVIVHITEHKTASALRPQVYFSGEIHGDERVGPIAVVEFARLLCEQYASNPWIRHLVQTRQIFMTPITNAIGFDQSNRQELLVDPNRDYPIDQIKDEDCMRAITSRIVNELFRTHLFQLAVTFHAGMEAIAVEWGTTNRLAKNLHPSPDDVAQLAIGRALSKYAGSFAGTREYPVGRMNDIVYPVHGGMEDWAYAGSWDPQSRRNPCKPSSHGGYSSEKTTYASQMLRVVNILVETSNDKKPSQESLGTSEGILDPQGKGGGHVSRNVRLALALTDLVEPYVVWTTSPALTQDSEVVAEGDVVLLSWEVGGGFDVDATQLLLLGPNGEAASSPVQTGVTRWKSQTQQDRALYPFVSTFSACVRVPKWGINTTAVAKVDSAWSTSEQAKAASPRDMAPQSHVVNARTNTKWSATLGDSSVRGREWWASQRLLVGAKAKSASGGPKVDPKCTGGAAVIVEASPSMGTPTSPPPSSVPPPTPPTTSVDDSSNNNDEDNNDSDLGSSLGSFVPWALGGLLSAGAVAYAVRLRRGARPHQQHRVLRTEENYDEDLDDDVEVGRLGPANL